MALHGTTQIFIELWKPLCWDKALIHAEDGVFICYEILGILFHSLPLQKHSHGKDQVLLEEIRALQRKNVAEYATQMV